MNKNKKTMKSLLTISLFLCCLSSIQAQEKQFLTLNQCRNMAIENSEILKIADQTIAKSKNQKIAARSHFFPNISASATGIYNKNQFEKEVILPTKVFDPNQLDIVPNLFLHPLTGKPIIGPNGYPIFKTYAFLPIDLTIYGGIMAGVSAEQALFAGGKIITGNKMADIGKNMAIENKDLQKNKLIYETDQMYYLYLATKEKVKLAKKYKELLSELLKLVENSLETGMIGRNKLLKVKVQYNNATLQMQKAESGLKLASMALCRVIGLDLNTPIAINDSMQHIEFDKKNLSDTSPNVTQRLEYKLMEQQSQLAEKNVKMIRGEYLPTVGISVGYNYFNVFMEGLMKNYDSHGFNALFSVKIPIVNFGERSGKIGVAKAELATQKLQFQQTEKLLTLETEQAKLNLIDAYTRIEMSKEGLKQAKENLRVSTDHYELGMETIVNLLEAQAQWQKTYSEHIDALADFKVKESNYLRIINAFE